MGYILGFYRANGKENGNYYTIIVYILGLLGYVGLMDKKMETTIMGHIGFCILGFRV